MPSLRLLTKPACEAADSDGSRNVVRSEDRRSHGSAAAGGRPARAPRGPASRARSTTDGRAQTGDGQAKEERLRPQAGRGRRCTPVTRAASATAQYPAASLRPIARPRRAGPTRSIFMITVVDQARPWLTPEQDVGRHDPAPVGRPDEQEGHRQRRTASRPRARASGRTDPPARRPPGWRLPW